MKFQAALSLIAFVLIGCTGKVVRGPDKSGLAMARGAAIGAGTGAVTGFHVAAASGPGVAIGAGLGAVAGAVNGAFSDLEESEVAKLKQEIEDEQERASTHHLLAEQMERRLRMHPTREIYPADIFFEGDEVTLSKQGHSIVKELSRINKTRKPWSRIIVAAYVKATDPESNYAKHLSEKRARNIGDDLIRSGIEAHRVLTRAVVLDQPILVDPQDESDRFSQSVEIILIDK